MPGIYGVASGTFKGLHLVSDRMFTEVTSRRDARLFVHDPVQAEGFAGFALVNRMFADLKTPYEDADVLVLFDGNLFNLDEIGLGEHTYAEAVAALYKSEGERFAARLRGHFVIALLDKREQVLRVYADPMITKPIFYMHHGGALYFSSELKALMPVGPVPKHADLRALNNMAFTGFVITLRTVAKEVTELKGGGMLSYNIREDRLTVGEYYSHVYQTLPLSRGEHMERAGAAMLKAFDRVFRHTVNHGRKILITVTGGMDSRSMAAVACRNFPGAVFGITHRFHDDYEMDYAQNVCAALGMNQIRVILDGGDKLRETIDAAVVAAESMAHFNDVWRFAATVKDLNPEEFGVMHTGVPGSAAWGTFVKPEMLRNPGGSINDPLTAPTVRRVLRSFGLFSHPHATRMFFDVVGDGTNRFEMIHEDLREVARLGWEGPREWALERERITVYSRDVRGVRGSFRGIEERMDFSAPFWDLDFFRAAMEMPARVKVLANIYYDFLRKRVLPRKLRRLPNTRNFGPLRKSTSLAWMEHHWKLRFLRGILGRLSKKKYGRIYGCSYRYVVQSDPNLRNFMADMLLDLPEPSVFGIDPAKWKRVIERWRKDPTPYLLLTRHFFWLLFFKRWFDFWGRYVSL
jgi:hypothetical protein